MLTFLRRESISMDSYDNLFRNIDIFEREDKLIKFFKCGEREVVETILKSLCFSFDFLDERQSVTSLNKKGVKAILFRPQSSNKETKDFQR